MKDKQLQPLRIIVDRTLPPVVAVVGYSGAGKTTYKEFCAQAGNFQA